MRGEREEETGSVVRGMPGRGGLPRLDGMRSRTRALLLTALAGVMLLGAAPLAASADVDDADVNDFDYSSWHSRVELGMDAEGRSTAHVTETLVAEFPTTDQNRGIVRGYPERYEGAGLSLDIVSVTDADGEPVPHEVDAGENGVTYVLTGDDDFVHGPTTYVIEYTMRDVLLAAEGSGLDEFYWDLLPLDSTQDIGQFSADIVLSPALADAYTGESACYQGAQGETQTCALEGPSTDGDLFVVRSAGLPAGDGITVALGFDAGTVVQPPGRVADPAADLGAAIAAGGTMVLSAASWIAWALFVRGRRRAGGFIVAQYDVPTDLPPLLAAALLATPSDVIPAQIAHLAVRGALRIEDAPDGGGAVLRLQNRAAASTDLDRRTLSVLFPDDDSPTITLTGVDEALATQLTALVDGGKKEAARRGWTEKARSPIAVALCLAAIIALVSTLGFMVWSIVRDRDLIALSILAASLAGAAVLVTAIIAFSRPVVLTAAGAERHAYLMGVREFIRVAESDRIRMLQSATGAERRPDGEADVVVLYERLLPYAMLFGEEKSWARVLEVAYADAHAQPTWITGGHGIGFAVAMSSFSHSTEAAATYSAPSASGSSSFGGSMGGGFSGGGGGGGFSGGR